MSIALSGISYFMFINSANTPSMVVLLVVIYNGGITSFTRRRDCANSIKAFFGYSWGPIPWLYPPEILPLSIRAKGASLSTATNWAFNWLVGQLTPVLQEWITWRLYLLHAFFCAASFVVVFFLYPETKGVQLEEMVRLSRTYSYEKAHQLYRISYSETSSRPIKNHWSLQERTW